ncbi:MAG: hypothetical protein Hens2KO_31940 [Henriciella sp.]
MYGDIAPKEICGSGESEWIVSTPPPNADAYRALALKNPVHKSSKLTTDEWGHYEDETWLTNSSSEVILCLADGPPWEAWSTRFWKFNAGEQSAAAIDIVDRGATIIVG